MSESFIDRLGAELARAASAPLPAQGVARRRRRWRPFALVPLMTVVATASALAAAGILSPGAPVAPSRPPRPTVEQGAPVPSSAVLLALRVADPAGGPPWGLRVVPTTRGDVCLQVGRLAYGTIGALVGHRFHPFSLDYLQNPPACSPLDAHGHSFQSVAEYGLPPSAIEPSRPRPGEARDVYFGLLGPDAASITYTSPTGRHVTIPTVGADGAYLIVTRGGWRPNQGSADEYVGLLKAGPILAVTYRDGRTCRPTAVYPCAPVGLAAPGTPRLDPAGVTSRVRTAELACTVGRCGRQVSGGPPFALDLRVSFIARAPVRTDGSFYYVPFFFSGTSGCHELADSIETSSDIRAGQRITVSEPILAGCHGVIRGAVRFHPYTGADSAAPEPDPVDRTSLTVGSFAFRVR